MSSSLKVLTSSSTNCFRRCPRLYKYRYVDMYRATAVSDALYDGQLIHAGLEAWWNAKREGLRQPQADHAAFVALESGDPMRVAKIKAMLAGYSDRWWDVVVDVCEVEVEYTCPLVNPTTGKASRTWAHSGKIDAIAFVEGEHWVIEHKSTSMDIGAGSTYWMQLRLDNQVSNYLRGAQSLGYDCMGVIYDVLKKPALRPRLATPEAKRRYKASGELYANQREHDEAPHEYEARCIEAIASAPELYYQRGEVVRIGSESDDTAFDLWQTGKMIRDCELADRWPRHDKSCMAYNRPCDFFGPCTGSGDLDDPLQFRRAETEHEELKR